MGVGPSSPWSFSSSSSPTRSSSSSQRGRIFFEAARDAKQRFARVRKRSRTYTFGGSSHGGSSHPRQGDTSTSDGSADEDPKLTAAQEEHLRARIIELKLMLDHLPLKYVLQDISLLKSFRQFIKSQHASENLLFYLAVEKFRKHKYIRPNNNLQAILEEAEVRRPRGATTNVDLTKMHMNMARSYQLPMSNVGAIMDALKIYETFLQDGARMWVCVSPGTLQEIQNTLLKEPQLTTQNVFAKASEEAYLTMETDVLPRFVEDCRDEEVLERMAYYARVLKRRNKPRARASPSVQEQKHDIVAKEAPTKRRPKSSMAAALRRQGQATLERIRRTTSRKLEPINPPNLPEEPNPASSTVGMLQ